MLTSSARLRWHAQNQDGDRAYHPRLIREVSNRRVNKLKPSLLSLVAAFLAVYLIWGSTYLGIHYAIETIPPLLMAGLRFTIAGALLYAFMWCRGSTRPTKTQWKNATIVGGLLLCGGNGLICMAQRHVPTGISALLVATVPLFMALIDWMAFDGRKPSLKVAIGLVFGLVGVLVLVDPWQWQGKPINPWGAAAILVACVSWAIGSLFSRNADLPKAAFQATGMEMMGGGALLILVGTIRGEWSLVNVDAVSPRSALAVAYLVVFGSLIGFSAYIWLLQKVSSAAVSTYAYVNPIVAVLLGWLFLSEPIGPNTLIAGVLIIIAVLLITLRRRGLKQPMISTPPCRNEKRGVLCAASSDG